MEFAQAREKECAQLCVVTHPKKPWSSLSFFHLRAETWKPSQPPLFFSSGPPPRRPSCKGPARSCSGREAGGLPLTLYLRVSLLVEPTVCDPMFIWQKKNTTTALTEERNRTLDLVYIDRNVSNHWITCPHLRL
jgi:hypothetical protein